MASSTSGPVESESTSSPSPQLASGSQSGGVVGVAGVTCGHSRSGPVSSAPPSAVSLPPPPWAPRLPTPPPPPRPPDAPPSPLPPPSPVPPASGPSPLSPLLPPEVLPPVDRAALPPLPPLPSEPPVVTCPNCDGGGRGSSPQLAQSESTAATRAPYPRSNERFRMLF